MSFEPENIARKIERKEKIKKLFFLFLYVILIPVILFSLFLFILDLEKKGNIPQILDYEIYEVISDSMSPRLEKNDMIIIKKNIAIDKFKKGNIITFKNSIGEIITHRIYDITLANNVKIFITKGDNNGERDKDPVKYESIIGRVVYTIPAEFQILRNKIFFSVVVLLFIIITFKVTKTSRRKMERKLDREKYEKGSIW